MKCKNLKNILFYSLLAIPMDLSLWQKTKFPFLGLPEIKVQNQPTGPQWVITTDDDAGGFAYLLKPEERSRAPETQLSWVSKVLTAPQTRPTVPLTKDQDDYALRVGVLIDTGVANIKIPGRLGRQLKKHQLHISYYVFYALTQSQNKRCVPNAHSEFGVTCLTPAAQENYQMQPLKDFATVIQRDKKWPQEPQIIGLWIFADSDNSESKSAAELSALKLKTIQPEKPNGPTN